MLVKTLVENTSISDEFSNEHGLSLFIETDDKKILFDVGASELFLENARKLGARIEDVDYLVISHGHYDHGGGLDAFFDVNKSAEVFINEFAFQKHFSRRKNDEFKFIGINEKFKDKKQVIETGERFFVSEGVELFSCIKQISPIPSINDSLYMEEDETIKHDTFNHEQILVIEENGKTYLFTGCGHNGVINILEQFKKLKGHMPDYVIGGFHLSSGSLGIYASDAEIKVIGEYLNKIDAKYYTCHCTGEKPFLELREILSDKIEYIRVGSEQEI